jgi:hypothetical protein
LTPQAIMAFFHEQKWTKVCFHWRFSLLNTANM